MKRLCLLIALFICYSVSFVHAQDFSINELMQLRTGSLSKFEDVVMAKGYVLCDVSKDYDHYATFRKGNETISYGYVKNRHFTDIDTVINYTVVNEDEYKALKESVKDNPSNTCKTHFFTDESHILEVDMGNNVVVQFFTKLKDMPLYEIEVMTKDADMYYR